MWNPVLADFFFNWDEATALLFLLLAAPLLIWWAVVSIQTLLDLRAFIDQSYERLQRAFDGIRHRKQPQDGYVAIDYAVWIGFWSSVRKERVQIYVHRSDAWRLWWFTIRHTFFLHRGGGFYLIGATYWLVVERVKLIWK